MQFHKSNLDAYFATRKTPGPWIPRSVTVAYSRYFLKCIGVSATDPMWFRRGTIVSGDERMVYVLWHDWKPGDIPVMVALANLATPGANRRFAD